MNNYITFCSDRKYLNQLIAFCESLKLCDSECTLYINHYSFNDWEISRIKDAFPFVNFIKKKKLSENYHEINSKRLRDYVSTLDLLEPGIHFTLIDSDTIVNCPLNVKSFLEGHDAGFTVKRQGFVLNFGTIYGRNCDAFKNMLLGMSDEIDAIFTSKSILTQRVKCFGAADQSTLGTHLFGMRGPDEIDTKEREDFIGSTQNYRSASLKILDCAIYNETECVDDFKTPKVLHFKAGWHEAIRALKFENIGKYRRNNICSTQWLYWIGFYRSGISRLINYDVNRLSQSKPNFNLLESRLSGGIMASELMLLGSVIEMINPDCIFESGRHNGFSTQFLSENFKEKEIVSFDYRRDKLARRTEKRLGSFKNLRLLYGNSLYSMPELVSRRGKSAVVLIDGPKGKPALDLVVELFRDPNVIMCVVHDSYLGSEFREKLDEQKEFFYFASDNEVFGQFKDFDTNESRIGFEGKPYDFKTTIVGKKSYGPTLTFVYNTSSQTLRRRNLLFKNLEVKLKKIYHYFTEIFLKCYIFRA